MVIKTVETIQLKTQNDVVTLHFHHRPLMGHQAENCDQESAEEVVHLNEERRKNKEELD